MIVRVGTSGFSYDEWKGSFFKHEDEGTGPKLARRFMEAVP